MPTCSQAKIITNLETDINKRFFRLVNELPCELVDSGVDNSSSHAAAAADTNQNQTQTNVETIELTKINLNRRRVSKHDCLGAGERQRPIIAAIANSQKQAVGSSTSKLLRRIFFRRNDLVAVVKS